MTALSVSPASCRAGSANGIDRAIRLSTAAAVLAVAGVAAGHHPNRAAVTSHPAISASLPDRSRRIDHSPSGQTARTLFQDPGPAP